MSSRSGQKSHLLPPLQLQFLLSNFKRPPKRLQKNRFTRGLAKRAGKWWYKQFKQQRTLRWGAWVNWRYLEPNSVVSWTLKHQKSTLYIFMASILLDNDAVILNGVYWLFATKFVFLSILMFKTFITRVTFIIPSHTLFSSWIIFYN